MNWTGTSRDETAARLFFFLLFMDKLVPKLQGCDNFPTSSLLQRARRIRRHPDRPGPTRATTVSPFFTPQGKGLQLACSGGKMLSLCAPQQEGWFLFCLQSCAALWKDLKLSTDLQGNSIDFFLLYPAKPIKSTKERWIVSLPFLLSFCFYHQFSKKYNCPGILERTVIRVMLYSSTAHLIGW